MIPSYPMLLQRVYREGRDVPSRHGGTREILDLSVRFNPGDMIVRPGLNTALGFMELLQLVAGIFDVEAIKRVAPKANHALFTSQMAYGPRIAVQLPKVIQALEDDKDTRQAVLFIGSAEDGATSSQPCTSTIQFIRRGRFLHTLVTMRSWDLVKGITYDVTMFGGLALVVAWVLNLYPAEVVVRAGSAHVYDADQAKVYCLPDKPPHRWFEFGEAAFPSAGSELVDSMGALRLVQDWAKYQVKSPEWTVGAPFGITVQEA